MPRIRFAILVTGLAFTAVSPCFAQRQTDPAKFEWNVIASVNNTNYDGDDQISINIKITRLVGEPLPTSVKITIKDNADQPVTIIGHNHPPRPTG